LEEREKLIQDAIKQQEAEDPSARKENRENVKKTMRNKFNYNERQSQTLNSYIRDKCVSTEPPPSERFTGEITQWEIFDAYMAEISKESKKEKDKDRKGD
jgi:dynein intermediate chain 1